MNIKIKNVMTSGLSILIHRTHFLLTTQVFPEVSSLFYGMNKFTEVQVTRKSYCRNGNERNNVLKITETTHRIEGELFCFCPCRNANPLNSHNDIILNISV